MAIQWRKTTVETMESWNDGTPVPPPVDPTDPPVIPPPVDPTDPPVTPPPVDPTNPIPPVDIGPIPANALWISPTGSNAGAGTKESPWQTIDFAEEQSSAFEDLSGRTIVFTDGLHKTARSLAYVPSLFIKGSITLRAENPGKAVLMIADPPEGVVPRKSIAEFFSFQSIGITLHGLIFDGGWEHGFGFFKNHNCDGFRMLDCEVRNMGRHAFRPNGGRNVLIERCYFHHILNWEPGTGRVDAHAISAQDAVGVTIRGCITEQCSGDTFKSRTRVPT